MEATTGKREIEVGRVLSETFSTYGSHAGVLLGIAAIVFVIVGVLQNLLYAGGGLILGALAIIVSLVGWAIYTGFVVKLVEDVRDGRRDSSVGELLSAAGPAIVPLVLNGILRGIGVGIGFLLLIVPGLFLLTYWSVTSPAIVAERQGAIGAFGRSWSLVSGQGLSVFFVIVVMVLIYFAFSIVMAAIGLAFGDAGGVVLGTIASILTAPIVGLVSSILFFDLGGGGDHSDGAGSQDATASGTTDVGY